MSPLSLSRSPFSPSLPSLLPARVLLLLCFLPVFFIVLFSPIGVVGRRSTVFLSSLPTAFLFAAPPARLPAASSAPFWKTSLRKCCISCSVFAWSFCGVGPLAFPLFACPRWGGSCLVVATRSNLSFRLVLNHCLFFTSFFRFPVCLPLDELVHGA